MPSSQSPGVWLAYYADLSGWRVFASEIKALRHANENSMHVTFLPFGAEPREVINGG